MQLHRLVVPVVFPAGVAPGSSKGDGNRLAVERRTDAFVLRGTSTAGVLRHAYAAFKGLDPYAKGVTHWFGHALGELGDGHVDRPSRVRVADAVLNVGKGRSAIRNHNSIERHTGAVRDGGLFSVEALPPGTTAELLLTLECDDSEGITFLEDLLQALASGLCMGGNGARGIGLVRWNEAKGSPMVRTFDLHSLDDHAAWLDESWAHRNGEPWTGGRALAGAPSTADLSVEIELTVPRGQDVCVGDDTSLDFQIEPQRVGHANGTELWRIPGSSLRGVMRAWVTRLAARAAQRGECNPPADSAARFVKGGPASGDAIGWGFMTKSDREGAQDALLEPTTQLDAIVSCPVMRLFGSLFSAGRVHITDFFSTEPVSERRLQGRKHVAVDRITGGANEGFLFAHRALLAGVHFKGTLVIRNPSALEARWLAETLRALDLGVLRVGSSKSSGRLALARTPIATGKHEDSFSTIVPSEVSP